jgi:hypothetical protein
VSRSQHKASAGPQTHQPRSTRSPPTCQQTQHPHPPLPQPQPPPRPLPAPPRLRPPPRRPRRTPRLWSLPQLHRTPHLRLLSCRRLQPRCLQLLPRPSPRPRRLWALRCLRPRRPLHLLLPPRTIPRSAQLPTPARMPSRRRQLWPLPRLPHRLPRRPPPPYRAHPHTGPTPSSGQSPVSRPTLSRPALRRPLRRRRCRAWVRPQLSRGLWIAVRSGRPPRVVWTSLRQPTRSPFHVKRSSREMMVPRAKRRRWWTPRTTSTSLHDLWMTTP